MNILRNTSTALASVQLETERQNAKWGEQNHNLPEWMAILMEEVGEASKEAVDFHHGNKLTGDPDEDRATQRTRLLNFKKEMIQVAAVAVQIVESLERNELKAI